MANVNLLGFCPAASHRSAIVDRIGDHKASAAGVYI
jgi:hypothetical protein